jgi:hypothetical protein
VELLADAVGLPDVRYEAAMVAAGCSLLAGDVDAAESANQAVLDFGTAAGTPDALAAYGGVMYAICQHRGTTEDIAEYFLEAARDNPSIAALRSTVPEMLCELDRIEEASKHLEAEAANGFDYPYDGHWLSSMVNLTDAVVTTRNREAVQVLLDRLRPYADHVISPQGIIVTGAVARPLARAATLLGEYEAAEAWFALSHDLHSGQRADSSITLTYVLPAAPTTTCRRLALSQPLQRPLQRSTAALGSADEPPPWSPSSEPNGTSEPKTDHSE